MLSPEITIRRMWEQKQFHNLGREAEVFGETEAEYSN